MARMSSPRVGFSATTTRGARASSRATTTFCWLPPLSAAAGASGPGATTSNALSSAAVRARATRQSIRPRRTQGSSAREPSTTFSVRVNSGIRPSVVRSSGTNATGPATSRRPRSGCRRPATERSSSRCPFPSTAAMPTISPARMLSVARRTAIP